jgi:hypothetical protein
MGALLFLVLHITPTVFQKSCPTYHLIPVPLGKSVRETGRTNNSRSSSCAFQVPRFCSYAFFLAGPVAFPNRRNRYTVKKRPSYQTEKQMGNTQQNSHGLPNPRLIKINFSSVPYIQHGKEKSSLLDEQSLLLCNSHPSFHLNRGFSTARKPSSGATQGRNFSARLAGECLDTCTIFANLYGYFRLYFLCCFPDLTSEHSVLAAVVMVDAHNFTCLWQSPLQVLTAHVFRPVARLPLSPHSLSFIQGITIFASLSPPILSFPISLEL